MSSDISSSPLKPQNAQRTFNEPLLLCVMARDQLSVQANKDLVGLEPGWATGVE